MTLTTKEPMDVWYEHTDSSLGALLSFDPHCGVWIVEYYREQKFISSALYLSRATALLMLGSLGYDLRNRRAC
jgi:hypothetical protein